MQNERKDFKEDEDNSNASLYDRYVPRFSKAFQGGLCAIEGGLQSLQNPEIKTNYLAFLKQTFVVSLGLYFLVGIVAFMGAPLFALLGFAPVLQLITMVPLWSLSIARKRNPVSSNRLFLSELARLDAKLAKDLESMASQADSKGWVSGITSDLLKSLHFLKFSALFALIGVVPLVGPLASLAAQVIFNASKLGWNVMTIYTVSCKKMSYKQHKRWIRARRWTLLGYGLVYSVLASVPLVGPLVLGFAQASAAHLLKFGFYNADVPLKKRERRQRDRALAKAADGLAEPVEEAPSASAVMRPAARRETLPLKRDAPAFIPMVKEPSFMKVNKDRAFEKKNRSGPLKINDLPEALKSN